jgi:hypothetical protein
MLAGWGLPVAGRAEATAPSGVVITRVVWLNRPVD